MDISAQLGYYAEGYFSHTKQHFSGIVVEVINRPGYVNESAPIKTRPLVFIQTDTEVVCCDESYLTKCEKPKHFVNYKHYERKKNRNLKNPTRTKNKNVFIGTALDLWYVALPSIYEGHRGMVFDNKKIVSLFLNSTATIKIKYGFGGTLFRIKRKQLIRLISQNRNRCLERAKVTCAKVTQSNFEDERDYWEDIRRDMERKFEDNYD